METNKWILLLSPVSRVARADDAAEVDVAAVSADAVDGARVDGGGDAAPEDQRVAPAARLPAAVRPNSRYLNTQVTLLSK